MRTSQPISEVVPGSTRRASTSQNRIGIEPNGSSSFEQALLYALQAMRLGDFTVRLTGDQTGSAGKIADTFNDIVATTQQMAQQLEHVGNVVGREGKTRQRAKFGLLHGAWGEMETSVNALIDELLWPTDIVHAQLGVFANLPGEEA
jgi:hypothetical protein